MHSPFSFSWAATASTFSTAYQPLDDSSIDDAPHYTASDTYSGGSRLGILSPVDEDVWSTFHFPSSPLELDESELQPDAPLAAVACTLPAPVTVAATLSSASSPHVTPAIRHLRLGSDLSIFPNFSAQPSSAGSAASTPQRSSPGSPTVAAFLANPELLPKLLGRGKHQPQPVSLHPTTHFTSLH